MKLFINALTKYIAGLLLVGLLVFLPAGTFDYFNGWLFILLLFVPILILGVVLFIKAPALLEKRLHSTERDATQKKVVALSALLFFLGFVVAGIDFRFSLTQIPIWLVVAASVVLIVSYAFYAEVMRENVYLSRIVEVQKGQKVIDSGLYGIVRHPMYAVTLWLFISIPIILGSWLSLIFFLPYIPIIIIRILNEEKLLTNELEGYAEYKKRVKYRLIPFIW